MKYHPDTRFLTDYSAGTLPESQALCVASHLHYCHQCRQRVGELTSLGEILFISQQPLDTGPAAFDKLITRIDSGTYGHSSSPVVPPENPVSGTELPSMINKLTSGNLDNLKWSRVGKRFRYSRLNGKNAERETALFHIQPGGYVPHHEHGGDEITVVLQGSFSDHEDQYHAGDFILRSKGQKHKPVAAQSGDCLCLSTFDAPIRMSNPFLRLVMPFLNLRFA